ncbi:MAG: DUF5677 domain-containing protein [Candidatus Omnitrophota bacterium]
MEKKKNITRNSNETKLSGHKRIKKELKPPFMQILNLKPSSWIDERLPEMLWAVLVIGNMERLKALEFFRYIACYVDKNKDCYDITLTGVSKFPVDKKEEFIKSIISWSDEIKIVLRPLVLFPGLPAIDVWKSYLGQPELEEDWEKLGMGVSKTLWHQTEEATDCRWVKILCQICGDQLHLPSSPNSADDLLKEIIEYPNYGELTKVRPLIRSLEISPDPRSKGGPSEWAISFWQYCFNETGCLPMEAVSEKNNKRKKELIDETEAARKYYFEEAKKIRDKLIDHLIVTAKTSAIDSRHEGVFGIALFSLNLFIEIIIYRLSLSISGRGSLRMLVESYIVFKYLLKKEKNESNVWNDYRSYGSGQLKLIYLKLNELGEQISSVDIDELADFANEDKWVEFVTINLGHWDSSNLRIISEEVGLKILYDKFYNYTSGYMHANWGAIRESVYQKCMNPLHRLHRVPTYGLSSMSSITNDAIEVTNYILESLSEAYPKFEFRLKRFDIATEREASEKNPGDTTLNPLKKEN